MLLIMLIMARTRTHTFCGSAQNEAAKDANEWIIETEHSERSTECLSIACFLLSYTRFDWREIEVVMGGGYWLVYIQRHTEINPNNRLDFITNGRIFASDVCLLCRDHLFVLNWLLHLIHSKLKDISNTL